MSPPAVVMNMFYTGLGIARSLGRRGVPVIGLSSQRGIYGNFTRYAKVLVAPDSRNEPDRLLAYLLQLGPSLEQRAVIFPTRDDDVTFLDRFRSQLEPFFILTIPEPAVVRACLNKWETYHHARLAGVPTPACWLIEGEEDLARAMAEASFPCVLKPVEAHHWRRGRNWEIVGRRKAIAVDSSKQLESEYAIVSQAEPRALLQELVPGDDRLLGISAVYFNRESVCVAGFNTRKLAQWPEGFGTGCVVQSADLPDLLAPTLRLLERMRFTGIAEVEYKWQSADGQYQLIEVNPRAWDQHPLGGTCGKDLVWLAYCDVAGMAPPLTADKPVGVKWVAEDAFLMSALRLLWKRDSKLRQLLQLARGKRIYAIWDFRDPLPSIAYFVTSFLPSLMSLAFQTFRVKLGGSLPAWESRANSPQSRLKEDSDG